MEYIGKELQLFEKAVHWKNYWANQIAAHIHGDVLEVGAGIGANTPLFAALDFKRWTCLEPDPSLLAECKKKLRNYPRYDFVEGTVADVGGVFDVLLYIDVLEHIEDDRAEMLRAAQRLNPGGTLIILVPAHQWLYSALDSAVGHFRRYKKKTLTGVIPPTLTQEKIVYLDSIGLLASLANKLFLRQGMPTETQIRIWDSFLIPISTILDRIIGYHAGKSALGIWTKY